MPKVLPSDISRISIIIQLHHNSLQQNVIFAYLSGPLVSDDTVLSEFVFEIHI